MVIGKTHRIRIVCFQLWQGNSEELVASNLWIISHLLIKIDYNITRKILTSGGNSSAKINSRIGRTDEGTASNSSTSGLN